MSTKQEENQQQEGMSVGEAVKAQQNGSLPAGSVEDLLQAAPKDIKTEQVDIPEWGFSIKLRSFTASQSARIRQIGVTLKGETQLVSWGEMEMTQIREGVVEPHLSKEQVHQLYSQSGPGVQRIIKWLDENSGMNKEEVRKTREEFQGSDE